MRTIGILGGAGVGASAALVQRIVDLVTDNGAEFDQEHPRLILLHATDAPSRSMWLEGRGPTFVPAYIDAARSLKAAGADFIAMCCNTAHAAHAQIAAEADIEMLNLIDIAIGAALKQVSQNGRIGILCSDGTRAAKIFNNAMERIAPNIAILEPDIANQKRVTQGIIAVKRGRHRDPKGETPPSELFSSAANSLMDAGAEVIILGCTEIPLAWDNMAWDKNRAKVPIIDTIDLLARACLRASNTKGF